EKRRARSSPISSAKGPDRFAQPALTGTAPAHVSLRQGEAFVGVGGDSVTFLYVGREAADVRHEHARLARHVGADIPGATGGAQRATGDFADMRDPVFLGLGLRLDAAEPLFAQIPN